MIPLKKKTNKYVNRTTLFPFPIPNRRFCIYGFSMWVLSEPHNKDIFMNVLCPSIVMYSRLYLQIMCCDAKSCPSTNKLSKKNPPKRTYTKKERYEDLPRQEYPWWKLRNTEVAHPTLSLYCSLDVCAIPRVKGRNRKRGRDERVYAYRTFYNFAGWIGIKFHCVARARWVFARWMTSG